MSRSSLIAIFLLVAGFLAWVQQTAMAQSDIPTCSGSDKPIATTSNGIFVGGPKVYDDRSLQSLLDNLRARLGQLSGLDQASLISRIGSLQGASVSQLGLSAQGSSLPLPGTTTTLSSAGQQTQVTAPTVTPTPPPLPNIPSFTPPSTFSQSALNTLNEQMQLNYEIINLQMLLEGSLNDQYVKGKYVKKHHVTLGFPISISVPSEDYSNAVAEVEITICNMDESSKVEPPSLMAVLPREKTYNVAAISNKLSSLGAGAIVSGIINLGVSFLWGHQSYYIVQDQDTIAVQLNARTEVCKSAKGVTFVWQFHPILGEKTVRQGLRQTFAQLAFSPLENKEFRPFEPTEEEEEKEQMEQPDDIGCVSVTTRWRKYNAKTGIVGDELPGSSNHMPNSSIVNFDKRPIRSKVDTEDRHDGTMMVRVWGEYRSGTRVRIGSIFLDKSTPGFQHEPSYIQFIAANQPLALNGARLVYPNGSETKIDHSWVDVYEKKPVYSDGKPREAYFYDFSPNLVKVVVPKGNLYVTPSPALNVFSTYDFEALMDAGGGVRYWWIGGPYPLIVTLGGKAFGLSDAPFEDNTKKDVSFLAPKDLIKNQRTLIMKRLFLGKEFTHVYNISTMTDVSSITVLSANEKETTFALLGVGLWDDVIKVLYPPGITISTQDKTDGTMAFMDIKAKQLKGLKQIVLQRSDYPPLLVAIPDSKPSEKKPSLSDHGPIEPTKGVTYTINGGMLESVAAIQYLDKKLSFNLSLDKKSLTLKLPDEMTESPGIRWLDIIYVDKSMERYKVEVSNLKAK